MAEILEPYLRHFTQGSLLTWNPDQARPETQSRHVDTDTGPNCEGLSLT